eukprot:Blabericola_migrator_1__10002@NODE_553_length_7646_cov_26_017417_g416_i0_p5_GENE_NODE_553_length_7646_cov_26_017417_g416_i0NODE_553_length_7646_cov_26_017417_g416_i0_p5_ORF_typecomplete_len198_score16_06Condensation/PF00668_20/0_043_NODE_553_length_7646_cov_26_017417_g416_i0386979
MKSILVAIISKAMQEPNTVIPHTTKLRGADECKMLQDKIAIQEFAERQTESTIVAEQISLLQQRLRTTHTSPQAALKAGWALCNAFYLKRRPLRTLTLHRAFQKLRLWVLRHRPSVKVITRAARQIAGVAHSRMCRGERKLNGTCLKAPSSASRFTGAPLCRSSLRLLCVKISNLFGVASKNKANESPHYHLDKSHC